MKYSLKFYPELKQKIDAMTVDELLLSVIIPNINAEKTTPPRNTPSVFVHPTTTDVAIKAAHEANDGREHAALIVSDMEYGAGTALKGAVEFPSMMAVALTGDENNAYEMGVVAAQEARAAGYHWTFGPCVDILMNHDNPIVSTRAPGDDVDTVIKYGGAYMRGLQDTGLIATLKHFPGDGCSIDDQHLAVTVNPLSREEWEASFGKVYSTLIEQGAMAVMPGHISLPAYDTPDENGIYPPATMSQALLTDLLKNKLGFEGIIVSDAVNMGGFCGYKNIYEACARFLSAGGDCLLFMHGTDEYLSEMKKHIASGLLTVETLKDRAYRMMCFGHHYFESCKDMADKPFDRNYAEALARKVVKNSTRIEYDRVNLLPYKINEKTRIGHVIFMNAAMASREPIDALTERLRALGASVTTLDDVGPDALKNEAKSGKYDLLICSVMAGHAYGTNVAKLCGPLARNMMSGWMRYGVPTLFISYKNPYIKEQYASSIDTLINTYGCTPDTPDAIIDLIVGKNSD